MTVPMKFMDGMSAELRQFLTSLQQVDDAVNTALNEFVELLDAEDRLTASSIVCSMFMENTELWARRCDELCEQ